MSNNTTVIHLEEVVGRTPEGYVQPSDEYLEMKITLTPEEIKSILKRRWCITDKGNHIISIFTDYNELEEDSEELIINISLEDFYKVFGENIIEIDYVDCR